MPSGSTTESRLVPLSDSSHAPTALIGEKACLFSSTVRETSLPRLDGYEVLGELGRGGMGVVYKARQTSLNRVVAVKMVLGGAFADEDRLNRFRREAEAVARLQHPVIVQVFEVGVRRDLTTNGVACPYITLEFVEGGSLAQRLAGRPQPPRECARLVESLARAVHFAHQRGIIHRDLKPANVLLTTDGTPKLTDFGLAKEIGGPDTRTVSGLAMGTPEYMSPEQFSGRGNVGPAIDIYALGVILYEMLTGRRPFEAESALSLMDRVLHDEPRAPRRLQPDVPRDLEVICLKCLAKEPSRRYPSAAALADDLARFQADEPIRARPQGAVERVAHWCRRRPVIAAMTAALILVVLAGFGGVTAMWRLADAHSHVAEIKSNEAREALKGEAKARAEGQLHIARLDGVIAGQLLEEGDLLASLPWLAEMMQLEEQGLADRADELAVRRRIHRTRLAEVLRRCPRPLQIWTHGHQLQNAVFSADGRQVFTAAEREPVRSWDTENGEAVLELPRGSFSSTMIAQSSTGLIAVANGSENHKLAQIILLDTTRGVCIGEPLELNGPVRHLALSPDASHLIVSIHESVQVWDLATRQRLWGATPPRGEGLGRITAVAFAANGKRVIAVGGSEPELRDTSSGELIARLKAAGAESGGVNALAVSPDGRVIASCGRDGARLWDAETGQALLHLPHGEGVWHAAFSPDGRYLATGGGDGMVHVWEIGVARPKVTCRHAERIVQVAFSPDGRRLLTASHDATARVWDVATGRPLLPPLRHGRPLVAVAFHPDGDRVLTAAADGVARLWDVTDASQLTRPLRHGAPVRHAAFDRDGKRIATAGENGGLRIWDTDGKPLSPWMRHTDRLAHVAFHPDGKSLVTAGYAPRPSGTSMGTVQTWDIAPASPGKLRLGIGAGKVSQASFSHDGTRLLVSGPYAANVFDLALGHDIVGINHGYALRHAAFSPDGARVAVATTISFGSWEAGSGKQFRNNSTAANHVAFSPDGTRLAVAGASNTAGVFDARTGKPLTPPLPHDGPVKHVAFSPDGRTLATACEDRWVRMWDAHTGQLLLPPLPHRGPVSIAAFSADGSRVLTVCQVSTDRGPEGRIRWWDATSGEPLTPPLAHAGEIYHAVAAPHSHLVVMACQNGAAWLWPAAEPDTWPVDDLQRFAEVMSGQRLDPRSGPVAVAPEALDQSWRMLRERYPERFARHAARIDAWRRAEAEECEAAGNWFAAVWYLDRMRAVAPTDWELTAWRGHLHLVVGESELANDLLTEAARRGPSDQIQAWLKDRADRAMGSGRWRIARWYLDLLLTAQPDNVPLLVERSTVRARMKDATGRTADLARAVELGASGTVTAQLAELRARDGAWSEAARLFALAAERDAEFPMQWALACLKAGDHVGYRRVCEEQLSRASTNKANLTLMNETAWLCALGPNAAADMSRAIKIAEAAVAAAPEQSRHACLNTLGALLYRAGRYREAIDRLREAIQLDSSDEDWIFLGLAHHALGETEEAKRCLKKLHPIPRPHGDSFSWAAVERDYLRNLLEVVR